VKVFTTQVPSPASAVHELRSHLVHQVEVLDDISDGLDGAHWGTRGLVKDGTEDACAFVVDGVPGLLVGGVLIVAVVVEALLAARADARLLLPPGAEVPVLPDLARFLFLLGSLGYVTLLHGIGQPLRRRWVVANHQRDALRVGHVALEPVADDVHQDVPDKGATLAWGNTHLDLLGHRAAEEGGLQGRPLPAGGLLEHFDDRLRPAAGQQGLKILGGERLQLFIRELPDALVLWDSNRSSRAGSRSQAGRRGRRRLPRRATGHRRRFQTLGRRFFSEISESHFPGGLCGP